MHKRGMPFYHRKLAMPDLKLVMPDLALVCVYAREKQQSGLVFEMKKGNGHGAGTQSL